MSGQEPTAACLECEPDLEAYLLGTLEGSRRSRMEGHLDACPACRHALAEARIGLQALRALAEAPAPFLFDEVADAESPHSAVPAPGGSPATAPGNLREEGVLRAPGRAGTSPSPATAPETTRDGSVPRAPGRAGASPSPATAPETRRDGSVLRAPGRAGTSSWPATAAENSRDGGHRGKAGARWPSWSGWAAAAALLLVGVAVGRWTLPGGDDPAARSDPPRDAWIQPAQIEALARAEVLLDLGVPWLEDLQAVLTGVIDATEAGAPEAALQELRRQARRLVLDGRKLRAALDAERDAELLATVTHAEVFLEEVAAFEPGRAPDFFTPSELSDLRVGFAAADARGAADRALLASGWIASESGL